MKMILVTVSVSFFSLAAFADGNQQTGNVINVNVGKACCAANPCKQKTKIVTKVVEKKVEVPVYVDVVKEVIVDRPVEVEKRVVVIKHVRKKNRIYLLGGMGPVKLDQVSPTQTNLDRGLVGGAMYQRSLTESWNIGIQGQTNQTVLGTVGYDF